MVFHSSGDVAEEIGRNEKRIEDSTATIQSNESELVGEANRKGDMILQGKLEEKSTGNQRKGRSYHRY